MGFFDFLTNGKHNKPKHDNPTHKDHTNQDRITLSFTEPSRIDLPRNVPWLKEAMSVMGLHEVKDNKELSEYLKSDKEFLGDPSVYPWCSEFVRTVIHKSLPLENTRNRRMETAPYMARSWLDFGTPCEPVLGAVLVFWRGSPQGHSGHVGFYIGEDDSHYYVLGGNQSNSVSITKISKTRLLGARFPTTSDVTLDMVGKRYIDDPHAVVTNNEA